MTRPHLERHTRERLTGAVILVALVVLLVPELLSGPRPRAARSAVSTDEPPVRAYTMSLGDDSAGGVTGQPGPAPPSNAAQMGGAVQASGAVRPSAPVPSGGAVRPSAPVQSGGAAPRASGPPPASAAVPSLPPPRPAPRMAGLGPPPAAKALAPSTEVHASQPAAGRTQSAEGWMVQLGSFGSRANAERLARQLKLKGYVASISQSVTGGRKWYRVRVGPERDRSAASAVAARLRAAGHAGAVVQPR